MLTALSVAHDCNMIHAGEKVIVIEATKPNIPPTFTYTQVYDRHGNEVRHNLSVCMYYHTHVLPISNTNIGHRVNLTINH